MIPKVGFVGAAFHAVDVAFSVRVICPHIRESGNETTGKPCVAEAK